MVANVTEHPQRWKTCTRGQGPRVDIRQHSVITSNGMQGAINSFYEI